MADQPTYVPGFDDPNANIVLKSDDGFKYRVPDYALMAASPLFVELLKANLSPSEVPIEASSDVVEAWLRLFHVFDNGNGEPIFQDLIQGLKVEELSEKYQTGQLYLKWASEMDKLRRSWGRKWSMAEMSAAFAYVLQTQNLKWFDMAMSHPFW